MRFKILPILVMILLASLLTQAQVNYQFSSSTSAFTALVGGTQSPSWTITTSNDEAYTGATDIGFNFTYCGTTFDKFQVSSNGFLRLGSDLASATPADAINGALRNVIAPLWDDLAVVDLATDVTYELSGVSPNQVLTVEWKNVKWNKTASTTISFQVKLYETTNKIEFTYDNMSASTAGAATIGINNGVAAGTWGTFQSVNVGGAGNFHVSMLYPFNAIATGPVTNTLLTFTPVTPTPMSGSYTIGGDSPDFTTLSQAALALNINGVSGAVTMTVRNGTYDDIMHLTNISGTSSTNTVLIKKEDGSTVTLSPRNGSRNGSSSTTADFVVALLGTDYTTFDGIDITHNALNTSGPLQFEFGYFMANWNGTDGTMYNTVKNTVITGSTLAASPTNFRGIRTSGGGFTGVTATTGTVSYNTFKNFKIQQCGIAVYISGMNGTYPDVGNIITADPTYAGNTVGYNDLGSVTLSTTASGMRGVFMDAQDNIIIEKCEVRNISNTNTNATNDVVGIGTFTVNTSKNIAIQNNIIHGLSGVGTAGQVVYGIWMVAGTNVMVKNNKVYDLQGGSISTGTVRGILHNIASTVPNKVYLINNMVYDLRNPKSIASNYAVRCIELNSADSVFMYNNTLYLNTPTTLTTEFFATACLYIASSTNMELDYRNNIMVNLSSITTSATSKAICVAKTTTTIGTQISANTNNNLLYAGAPDAKHVLAFDAATGYQTLTTYRAWLTGGRESNALSEMPPFVSSTPSYDLHISNAAPTLLEGGASFVSLVTTDIDGDLRNGYAPDLGADEFNGTYEITIDGSAGDWRGSVPGTLHAAHTSYHEIVYKGEASDERTDYNATQSSSDNDITEVRFSNDDTYLYLLVRMRDITNIEFPHLCFVFSNGVSSQNTIGDDSKRSWFNWGDRTPLGNPVQSGRMMDIHYSNAPVIELYDGGAWYAAPTGGELVSIDVTNDIIEARIKLADLGLNSSMTTNVTLMTAANRSVWNNDNDATAWGTDLETNGIDVMTVNAASGNSWVRDLSDGDVDNYFHLILGSQMLPVELSSYTAAVKDRDVVLTWKTDTEKNSYQFIVERSTANSNGWMTAGTVNASGTSNSPKLYSFRDNNLAKGLYQYRLKIVDNDGTYEYSNIVEAEVGIPSEFSISQNYPNPFNPTTRIDYQVPVTSHVVIELYSIAGEKVAELVNTEVEAGYYIYNFNAIQNELASGVYIYRMIAVDKATNNSFVNSKKMMILK